jgi:predicted amidohydrolase YtcJ
MPTIAELTEAASDRPVFVLFAYGHVLLNKAGVAALKLVNERRRGEQLD